MKRFFLAAVVLLLAVQAEAEVKLPALLGSNMVLQRNTEVNFWGEASPRSRVLLTASWDGRTYDAKADAEGRWAMKIATGEAGGPYTVTVSDGKEVVLDNVMLGEVWVCSGQSNMEMPVSGFMFQPVEGAVDAIADAGMYPGIRMFTVPRVSSKTPLDDCDAAWQTATPASVGQFSAVGYFFGRMLYKALGIPVGLITSNWGGSTIEAWMTVDAIDATPGIDHAVAKSGTYDNSIPQRLYNGMILPVCRYTAKGFIWYQGESNRKNWYDYKALQVSLVKLWRETWGDGKMPFYYTQLALRGRHTAFAAAGDRGAVPGAGRNPALGDRCHDRLGQPDLHPSGAQARSGGAAGVPRPGERLRGDGAARPGAGIQVDGARRQ